MLEVFYDFKQLLFIYIIYLFIYIYSARRWVWLYPYCLGYLTFLTSNRFPYCVEGDDVKGRSMSSGQE